MFTDTDFACQLREKLGSESTGKWLEVMDFLVSELSFLRSAGRPTGSEIASSKIGRAGFDSFRQFTEEKPSAGGLGWSFGTYKAWKKAHSLVEKYPYLRELQISASEINTISRENEEFPTTLEAYLSLKNDRKMLLNERQQANSSSLQKKIDSITAQYEQTEAALALERASADNLKSVEEQLRKELTEAYKANGALNEQLNRFTDLSNKTKEKTESLTSTVDEKNTQLESLKKELKEKEKTLEIQKRKLKKYENMSSFEKFFFLFRK